MFLTQQELGIPDDSLTALPRLIAPEQPLFATQEMEIEANWKLVRTAARTR